MTKGKNTPKIDELIRAIPEEQLKIMKKIWDYFLQNKEWPKGRRFRREQGHSIVESVVTRLEPIFIWHMNKENPLEEHYKLTTEGVYAVEGLDGPSIKLILSYLDYLRKKFDKNPDLAEVTAQELREILHIKSEETRILGELLSMGNYRLWGGSASNLSSSDWKVGVIKDIEILFKANSSQEFLIKQWSDNIERILACRATKVPSIFVKQADIFRKILSNKFTQLFLVILFLIVVFYFLVYGFLNIEKKRGNTGMHNIDWGRSVYNIQKIKFIIIMQLPFVQYHGQKVLSNL